MAASQHLNIEQMEAQASKHGITTRKTQDFPAGNPEDRVRTGSPHNTTYTHYRPVRPGVVEQALEIQVSHVPDVTHYAYADSPEKGEHQAVADLTSGPEPKLFGMHTTPGKSAIVYASGTKEGRAHLGSMVGMAMEDTMREFPGRPMDVSQDLSQHSAKLVERSKARGLVKPEHTRRHENQMDFEASEHEDVLAIHGYAQHMGREILDPQVKRAGSRSMRAMLRNPSLMPGQQPSGPDDGLAKVKRTVNPDQLKLPGM